MIAAPEEFKPAIGKESSEIAGPVKARGWLTGEGIGNKLLRRQIRLLEIAPGDAVAAHVQFAGTPDGNWLKMLVQYIGMCVVKRSSQRQHSPYLFLPLLFDRIGHDSDGGFCWAIVIDDPAVGRNLLQLLDKGPTRRLAANNQAPSRHELFGVCS